MIPREQGSESARIRFFLAKPPTPAILTQQFGVGSLGRMIPADTTGFVPSSRPRAAAIHGTPADHVMSDLAGWEPPMRRTTSMQRIGLRNLLVTGAMVLMLATGANANIINDPTNG